MIEIERKFLITSEKCIADATSSYEIKQGYLSIDPERTVRIRTKGTLGFITIKGKSSDNGLSRFEWEKEIPLNEALSLLALCKKHIIEKIRYEIKAGNHIYEIDKFEGMNEGLLLAEIELNNEYEIFKKPSWLGPEVTGDNKYYNSFLSKKPYITW
ncbi:CYTH domain-containing protein [Aquimarina sp. ERC-38]|uniref:CYTH domain-containing protein n=1 Tax=Aquimarina sp. ERC-38 TaxID=2949996 RepID=UPI0022450B14|nr:CYTH domain-containing protein [Aquimarina sp. ERC-38]UZO81919.1 CYTH domain-containing protein [Aquimarina sp. ERC-38]